MRPRLLVFQNQRSVNPSKGMVKFHMDKVSRKVLFIPDLHGHFWVARKFEKEESLFQDQFVNPRVTTFTVPL